MSDVKDLLVAVAGGTVHIVRDAKIDFEQILDVHLRSRLETETKEAANCGQAEASRKWIRSELSETQRNMLLQSFSKEGKNASLIQTYGEGVKMMQQLLRARTAPYERCDAVSFAQLFKGGKKPSNTLELVHILSSDEGSDRSDFFSQATSLVQRSAVKWVIITERAQDIPAYTREDILMTVSDVQNVKYNRQFQQYITDQKLSQSILPPVGIDDSALADETKERKNILAEADAFQRKETQRFRDDEQLVGYYFACYSQHARPGGVHVVFIIPTKSVALMISRWFHTQAPGTFSVVENPDSMWDTL
jgi:hypothetical protein